MQAREALVRQAAIARVDSQPVLAHCAVHDALAANRAVAASRLEEREALEQVARQVAKRDKTVYRLVRQKLKLIQEAEELPRRARALCEDLCEKLERLGRFDTWSQDLALLAHFDRQWAEIGAPRRHCVRGALRRSARPPARRLRRLPRCQRGRDCRRGGPRRPAPGAPRPARCPCRCRNPRRRGGHRRRVRPDQRALGGTVGAAGV